MEHKHLITLLSFLLLSSAFASITTNEGAPKERKVNIVVEGMVYCQTCDQTDTKPIPSAKVLVICKNHKNMMSYYKSFTTNEHGYYYAELHEFKTSHSLLDHPLHSCHVRAVSSPLSKCKIVKNFKYGSEGSLLGYENKRVYGSNYEAVVYSAGPLVFCPEQCH